MNNREFGRIFGKVMQERPEFDVRVVNHVLRIAFDNLAPDQVPGANQDAGGIPVYPPDFSGRRHVHADDITCEAAGELGHPYYVAGDLSPVTNRTGVKCCSALDDTCFGRGYACCDPSCIHFESRPEPVGGAAAYLAMVIEAWNSPEDRYFPDAIEEARQYMIETSGK